MTRFLSTLLCVLAMSGIALAGEGDDILARARARVAAEEFRPYRFHMVSHTLVKNGDEELEHEERSSEELIQWSPDSTEVIKVETELLFSTEEDSEGDSEADRDSKDKKGEELDMNFEFLSPEGEQAYRFDFKGLKTRGDMRLADFRVKPRKPSKNNWKGHIYIDPDNGALKAIDVEPAKGRFGMKRMRVRMKLAEALGMDLPMRMDMDLEVKVIFLFHKKISTRMEIAHMEAVE